MIRTKLEYKCIKGEDFDYLTREYIKTYSRAYNVVVTARTEEECLKGMDSFMDEILDKGIQNSFDSNINPEYDEVKNVWVGEVQIYISNENVTEEKEEIKYIYMSWKKNSLISSKQIEKAYDTTMGREEKENDKMNIREIMKVTKEDLIYKGKDSLVVLQGEKVKGIIDNYKIIENRIYRQGDKRLVPIFNANKFSKIEIDKYRKLTPKEVEKFTAENLDKMRVYGVDTDGSIVKHYKDYWLENEANIVNKEQETIHVIEKHSQGNLLCNGTHLVLSTRVSKACWGKIKHLFTYTNTKEFNDEVWGDSFIGYEIIKSNVDQLEELLEIPDALKYEHRKAKEEQEKLKLKKLIDEENEFARKLNKEFSSENSIDISNEVKELIDNNKFITLVGDRVNYIEEDIYGGGIWFIIQDDFIWKVYNNGHDGDYWGINFINTGGAGAYGEKYLKTDYRIQLLNELKKQVK